MPGITVTNGMWPMADWDSTDITDGTDQAGRIAVALQPGYFDVDELTFEQLLAMAARVASHVNFFNLKDEIQGTWHDMFTADEAVIMATILSTDLNHLEQDFADVFRSNVEDVAQFVLNWVRQINIWFIKLNRIEHKSAVALRQQLTTMIEDKLANELHKVGAIMSLTGPGTNAGTGNDFAEFASAWGIISRKGILEFPRTDIDTPQSDEAAKQHLRSAFYTITNGLSYLKTITPIYFQESLDSRQHDPAVALFMVFLRLYRKAQKTVNRFSERHLQYYYRDILKTKSRAPLGDSVHVILEARRNSDNILVLKDTEFSAGKDADLKDVVYCAANDVVVTESKVAALATLCLQHDDLVSPERELAYVTRIKADYPQSLDSNMGSQTIPWSLFGADKAGTHKGTSRNAEIGFSIASSLLFLEEGIRKIVVNIEVEDRSKTDTNALVSLLTNANTAQAFTAMFGRLFSRLLLTPDNWLSDTEKSNIVAKANDLLDHISAREVKELLRQDRQELLIKKIFTLKLTTTTGWLSIDDYTILPLPKGDNNRLGFNIVVVLAREDDAISSYHRDVHGGNLDTTLPLLQCCINAQTSFYAYSVFSDLAIKTVELMVDVKGINHLKAYNNHGQLDPSKPFHPFGPLPTCNSYLVFGNYELAKKRLTKLTLHLEWAELPTLDGGFKEYYAGHHREIDNRTFQGAFFALNNGYWQPNKNATNRRFALFSTDDANNRVRDHNSLNVDVVDFHTPLDRRCSESQFNYGLNARDGFFRLSLVAPEGAFGHTRYPHLLTEMASVNAKVKKQRPIPNAPYTPVLSRLSLDYRAVTEITMASIKNHVPNDSWSDKIIHNHPFGFEIVYPTNRGKPPFLLPQYRLAGNLFIGISAEQLAGTLTLLFHLSDDQPHRPMADRPPLKWFYLSADNWRPLTANQVLADTTDGFLSSGIVTLDIPSDITRSNNVMPDGLFWLRVSTDGDLQSFCSCYLVHANALRLNTRIGDGSKTSTHLVSQGKWEPMVAVSGLASVRQVGAPFGGREPETELQLKTRISERLRHKNRASLAWDYERLVLEHFPQVAKVKCFSNMDSRGGGSRPGSCLIVVVPHPRDGSVRACSGPMLNAVTLNQIKSMLQQLASPFVQIEVRNPVYEKVQVRCTVKFTHEGMSGFYERQLDQEISDYICPWTDIGYKARFGWSIRQKDAESYIRSLDYVEFVTNFSMLHITVDAENRYRLGDTAKGRKQQDMEVKPRMPWSLVVPARHHFIETTPVARSIEAQMTGIDELEIGNTFIISGNRNYDKEE